MQAHCWHHCKRSCSQSPSLEFLQLTENMPNTYLPSTPTDILHKLWYSNLVPNIPTTTAVWPPIWQKPNTHNLPIQPVLSPNYYNNEMTTAAITALYSSASDQSDFALWLPAKWHIRIPTELTVPTCSSQIHRNSHRPSNFILTTDRSHSTATGLPTGTAPLQQDYYVPWHQPEHHQTDLLPFHWYYMHIKPSTADLNKYPTINSTTNHLIWHCATLLYSMI